jgi:hypothetical protein
MLKSISSSRYRTVRVPAGILRPSYCLRARSVLNVMYLRGGEWGRRGRRGRRGRG